MSFFNQTCRGRLQQPFLEGCQHPWTIFFFKQGHPSTFKPENTPPFCTWENEQHECKLNVDVDYSFPRAAALLWVRIESEVGPAKLSGLGSRCHNEKHKWPVAPLMVERRMIWCPCVLSKGFLPKAQLQMYYYMCQI